MKRPLLWMIVCMIGIGVSQCGKDKGTEPSSRVVEFKDVRLEAAIRDALDKKTGDLTTDDLGSASLVELDLSFKGISDLTGIEHCTKLVHLDLFGNEVVDISPLVGLSSLEYLDLGGNPLLSDRSKNELIPSLQERGVVVKLGGGGLYVTNLSDVDIRVLAGAEPVVVSSGEEMVNVYQRGPLERETISMSVTLESSGGARQDIQVTIEERWDVLIRVTGVQSNYIAYEILGIR